MTEDELDLPCGRSLTFRDLIEVGETWYRTRVSNLPSEPETVVALSRLAEMILDPVMTEFGKLEITYGFASLALTRHISGRIDTARDQHAGHDLRSNGTPICRRLGQAVDFRVVGVSSRIICGWIAKHLAFDRLYFYGDDLPLHVSAGPDNLKMVVSMLPNSAGRRIPRIRSAEWLVAPLE